MNPTLAPKKEYVLPDTSRLSFTEKGHYYELGGKKLSGVTTVIDQTSSKANLITWAVRMAIEVLKKSVSLLFAAALKGRAEFDRVFAEVLEEAEKAHTKKKEAAGTKGTDTHGLVEEYIKVCLGATEEGLPALYDESYMADYKQIKPFIDWACENVDGFLAAEQRLYSETHAFAGTCDFVALIDGKLTIGDLKTFPKMWSADAFIQCGAYSLAWDELTGQRPEQTVIVKMCDPNDERIKKYGGKPFAVYPRYALAEDEEMFLTRLKMYRYNQAFTSPKE